MSFKKCRDRYIFLPFPITKMYKICKNGKQNTKDIILRKILPIDFIVTIFWKDWDLQKVERPYH